MIYLPFLTQRAGMGEIRFLALTTVQIECCICMDSTVFSWSHSCRGVLSQTDSSQRGFWQLLISQGSGRYMNRSHQTWEKAGGMRKVFGSAETNLFLLHSYLQGRSTAKHHHFNPKKAAPCRERHKNANVLTVILQGPWRTQVKEVDHNDKRALSLLYTL